MSLVDTENKNIANNDDKQKSVEYLRSASEKIRREGYEDRIDIRDVAKDIVFFLIYVGIGFGWVLLMLLIISFVSLGYLHFKLENMIVAASVSAILVGIYYIFRMIKKYRK